MALVLNRNPGQSVILEGGPFRRALMVTFLDTGRGLLVVDGDGRRLALMDDEDGPYVTVNLAPDVSLVILNDDQRMLLNRTRRRQGLCVACGKHPAPENALSCQACLDARAQSSWLNVSIKAPGNVHIRRAELPPREMLRR